jgi:sulfotransferase family protein
MTETLRRIRAKAARSSMIRNPWVWSWHVGLKSDDFFLASFPRSGSTWLRFMLFEILSGEDPGFRKIEDRLPEIRWHRGSQPILPGNRRLIKTHENYRSDYKRAVLLVRDVRDVFFSVHAGYDALGLSPIVSKGDMDSFMVSFLEGKAVHTGSWQLHTRSWLESPLGKNGNLLVVRYEDLRKNPEQKLSEILDYMGVTPNLQHIRKAIEDNTLQRMRKIEDTAKKAGEQSILLGNRKGVDEVSRFVRKGAVAGWREKLTEAQMKIFQQYAGDTLELLGYEPGLVAQEAVY